MIYRLFIIRKIIRPCGSVVPLIFLFTIFSTACLQLCSAQNPQHKIDSLLNVLKGAKEDTTKVNIQLILSKEYYRVGDQDSEKKYADNALQLAEKINYKKGEANANLDIGTIYSAQGNYAEALKAFSSSVKIYEEIGDKIGIADSYNNLGLVYSFQGNYSEALKNYLGSIKIYEESGNKSGIADSYINIGNIHVYQGNYPEALESYLSSLKIYRGIGDKVSTAEVNGNIGLIYLYQGNYPEALNNLYTSLKIFEELGNKRGVARCYINIANIYSKQDNHAEALKNNLTALKINEEIGDKHEASGCYINIGGLYMNLGNYPEALKNYFTALTIKEELGDKSGIAYSHHGIGNTYKKQGDFTNSLKHYFTALKIAEEIGDKNLTAICYSHIGTVYSLIGQYGLAIDYFNEGLDLAKMIGAKEITRNSYDGLSNVYEKRNDWKNAFRFQKLYFQMNDSIYNESKSKQLTEMQTKYESEKKEKEIALLTKDKEIQNIEIKKQKVLKYSFIGGLALTILLFFFGYRSYRARQVLRLQTLRNRIADDLHDDIGSTLNSISVYSEVAKQKSPAVVQELEQIGEASRKIIDAMSDIVWTINTRNDSFEQIILRLRSLTYNLLRAKNIEHTFRADESLNDMKLSMELRRNFYLIFKEALNNLVKYSGASLVSISLTLVNNYIILTIHDNGVGFDVTQNSTGNGLLSMKSRAEEMQAELKIESEPGSGTMVELKMKS